MFLLRVIFAVLICCPFIYMVMYLFGKLMRDVRRKR